MELSELWPMATFLSVYTGFIFAGFSWMLKAQTKQINTQIGYINEKLDNHITDTNKKIDDLKIDIKEQLSELKQDIKEIKKAINK